jgi:shikimate 5-dehydrogenase
LTLQACHRRCKNCFRQSKGALHAQGTVICCSGDGGDAAVALHGKTAVILGTGGAARALLFGAAARGAAVIVAGRNLGKAEALASQISQATACAATACTLDDVQKGRLERIDVVLNTTPLGMVGATVDQTPVPSSALEQVWLHGFTRVAAMPVSSFAAETADRPPP